MKLKTFFRTLRCEATHLRQRRLVVRLLQLVRLLELVRVLVLGVLGLAAPDVHVVALLLDLRPAQVKVGVRFLVRVDRFFGLAERLLVVALRPVQRRDLAAQVLGEVHALVEGLFALVPQVLREQRDALQHLQLQVLGDDLALAGQVGDLLEDALERLEGGESGKEGES